MKARTGARVAGALIALLALAGCSSAEPGLTAPKVDFDTPALRVLKKQAGIENCTAPTAAKASVSLPDFTAPCLGGGPKVDLARLRGSRLRTARRSSCIASAACLARTVPAGVKATCRVVRSSRRKPSLASSC